MEEKINVQAIFRFLVERYEITPAAADVLLKRILEILALDAEEPHYKREEEI